MPDLQLPNFTTLNPPERKRVYRFADGKLITYFDVMKLAVSERGTHRLELKDGRKVIVPAGFLAIELDVDNWTL